MHIITQPGTFQINSKKTHLPKIKWLRTRARECVRKRAENSTHTHTLTTIRTITTNDITEFIIAHTITLKMVAEQSAECKRERARDRQKPGLYQMAKYRLKDSKHRLNGDYQAIVGVCEERAYEYACTVHTQHSYCSQKYIKHSEKEWETATMK